jgi:predicted TIM-barrel fold metal-dependent hydrolase
MIIDADCHISSQRFDALAMTADDLLREMDRAGVDRALVWLRPPYTREVEPENRAVAEAMRSHPDRLLGFGWANPRLGTTAAETEISRCFEEYGFYGIKFNGAQDEYIIDAPEVLSLIERAAAYGKPIGFHIGADFYENTHPYRLAKIAGRFPDITFLMIHMGGAGKPALDHSAIEVALAHPNITLIGSAIDERPILSAIAALGPDRVCFGSDMPFNLIHVRLAMYRALLRDHKEETRAAVLGGTIARVLGVG